MAKFYRSEDKTVLLEVFGAGSSIENLKSLKANTTDAAVEKHVPVVTQEGNKITVAVSSVEHPMLPEHYIMGVYIETKNGVNRFYNPMKPSYTDAGTAWSTANNNVDIAAQPGMMIVFPSWIDHSAMPYRGTKNRYILSFNSQIGLVR